MNGRRVIIVGGGASGILLAIQLLRSADPQFRVTIVEKRGELGRGLAFSATQPDHVLNVPAARMSAYDDAPEHFQQRLRRLHPGLPDDPFLFAPRALYGSYLNDVLADAAASDGGARLTIVRGQAVELREWNGGVEVALRDGTSLVGQTVVLAVGHEGQPARGNGLAVRAGSDADTDLQSDAPVMILGSGLSMVDAWLGLTARHHTGRVRIVSRHGLLPLSHAPVAPLEIDAADVPFGTNIGYLMRWFRQLVIDTEATGGDWRSIVDGLRPFNQRLWQSWTPEGRHRFLEHVRPFWNIHRHRLPPRLHIRLKEAVATGQVELIAGSVLDIAAEKSGISVLIRRRGGSCETLHVARVYDCGGVTLDVTTSSNPVIKSMLAGCLARADPQRIGLEVTTSLQVVGSDGRPSDRIFAVGPLTRGQFFEIEAIPDIRRQVADLASRLTLLTPTSAG